MFPAPNQDASNQEIEEQRNTPQKRRKNHKQPNNQKKSKLTATPNYIPQNHPLPAFFVPAFPSSAPELTVHNFSTYHLTAEETQLLDKGLSFCPSLNVSPNDLLRGLIKDFDQFSRSLRLKYTQAKRTQEKTKPQRIQQYQNPIHPTTVSTLHRKFRFLPPTNPDTDITRYSGVAKLENYIEDTKQSIVDNLHLLCQNNKPNLTEKQQIALNKLQKNRKSITIKPADKNLGLVLMNTDHYIMQCLAHLTNTSTYRLTTSYPLEDIERNMVHILNNFKHELDNRDKRLYKFLQKSQQTTRIPCFYGIPKIHKKFARLPPLRPIVSQSASPLIGTAKFIDHVLQPVASSYPDYLHNSTALSITLQDLKVPEDAILVTIDVTSLYPSIPQTECLNVIYDELYTHRFLLTFNPNLIIRLLHLNINYNYFTFDKLVFQQIEGTAMGALFSPTVANIFMSIVLKKFLATQPIKPLILKRYIAR